MFRVLYALSQSVKRLPRGQGRLAFRTQHRLSTQSGLNRSNMSHISYLSQQDAKALDDELMGLEFGFSVDQLMELAGLSCATAIFDVYQPQLYPNILVVCGPGNNGGDGLVCARHLQHFGYQVHIVYPKRTDRQLYKNLVRQCEKLNIPIHSALPNGAELSASFQLIVDAIFGFSFSGEIRAPFDGIIRDMSIAGVPIASIDVPSGWDVEQGDVRKTNLLPELLISLTAPKLCASHFQGRYHYLGGRFVPPEISAKYKLNMPSYPGASQALRLSPPKL